MIFPVVDVITHHWHRRAFGKNEERCNLYDKFATLCV